MNDTQYKFGKRPARPQAVKFKFADFVNTSALPKPPRRFGHEDLVSEQWAMLGNDRAGNCVFAGAAHETMLWSRAGGRSAAFTDREVLGDYSAVTGYNPADPNSDQGTDMQTAASYRRKIGVVDSNGARHKVAAYLAIQPKNITEHYQAMYLFGAVGIGFEFPASAIKQFQLGRTWSYVLGSPILGGHYVPLVAKRAHLECVTWGKIQPMTIRFLQEYNDESIVYISPDAMSDTGKTLEGFDAAGLQAALNSLPVA